MKGIVLLLPFLFLTSVSAQLVSSSSVNLVGVQEFNGEQVGSIAELNVEIHNGSGRVFVDTMPLTEIDTQTSARLASQVSCDLLDVNCSDYDFFYIIRSSSPMIGGPSAGGAMGLATLLALTNSSKKDDVVMTGTINPDSTIGPVGGVLAKAETVYKSGFKTFLVPPTQSLVYTAGLDKVNLSEYAFINWGLNVFEVSNLDEVFEHFTGLVIERESVDGVDVVVEDYDFLMRFMASSLFEHVKEINSELHSKFDGSKVSYTVSEEIGLAINSSDDVVNNISALFENGDFYVAASKSLQEAINARYAFYLIDYDLAGSKNVFVKNVLDVVYDEIRFFVNNTNYSLILDNVYDLELVVASLDRLREAESIISSAFESFYATDYRGALYLSATALERLETARTCLNTTNHLSGSESFVFNASSLSTLASSSINDASIAITYASTLVSDSIIFHLQQELDGVTDFFVESKYARAIFESLSLKAEANLLMEVRGLTEDLLSSLFSTKRDNVVRLIIREERSGALPILAISYLLYADYFFEEGDLSNALRYLNYAAQYSSLSSDVFKVITGKSSSQINDGFVIVNENEKDLNNDYASFLLGMVFASIIFVLALSIKLIIS